MIARDCCCFRPSPATRGGATGARVVFDTWHVVRHTHGTCSARGVACCALHGMAWHGMAWHGMPHTVPPARRATACMMHLLAPHRSVPQEQYEPQDSGCTRPRRTRHTRRPRRRARLRKCALLRRTAAQRTASPTRAATGGRAVLTCRAACDRSKCRATSMPSCQSTTRCLSRATCNALRTTDRGGCRWVRPGFVTSL
jgi:hypothetical protein